MNEGYSQVFYVPMDKRHLFRGLSSDGCLVALVLCNGSQEKPDNDDTKHQEPEWPYRQWQYVQQLHGMVLYLQKQVVELAAKKRKEDYLYE